MRMTWRRVRFFSEKFSQTMLCSDPLGGCGVNPTISIWQESPLNFQYVAPIVLIIRWRASTSGHSLTNKN